MTGTQPTGNQPNPSLVEDAINEDQMQMTREQWILTQPWKLGIGYWQAIVCEPPPGYVDTQGLVRFCGGLPVTESCQRNVAAQIVELHNTAIGFGKPGVKEKR